MFFCLFRQTISSFLVISLLIPSAILFHPQKAEAATTCVSQISAALGVSKAVSTATNVPVNVGSLVKTSVGGSFVKDCILTPLAVQLAKAMLQNMTSSIVNWINSGFEGNPSFVMDLQGLVTDTIDDEIGRFIEQDLGAGFLCSPFSLQVKVAIAQSYLPYRQRAACTLTDIAGNVAGFVEDNNSGGWDDWLSVTTVPQNNVYGATILAQDELSRKIAEKLDLQNRELDWGKGFRSWKKCESDAEVTSRMRSEAGYGDDESYDDVFDVKANRKCETVTPGTVVESQLSLALGSDMRRLEVADSIDAIVGALTNQLMSQVISGGQGLLGAGKRSNGSPSSTSYQSAINPTTDDPALSNAIDSGIIKSVGEIDPLLTEPTTTPDTTDSGSGDGTNTE